MHTDVKQLYFADNDKEARKREKSGKDHEVVIIGKKEENQKLNLQ
jgi:hypothetical protein